MYLVVSNKVFPNGMRPIYANFVVLLHYPQQILRSVSTSKYAWPLRKENSTYDMSFIVDGIEIVSHRKKLNDPCLNNYKRFDDYVIAQHFLKVGCRNPYQKTQYNFSVCRTNRQLKAAKFDLTTNILTKYPPPCKAVEKIYYTYQGKELDSSKWKEKGNFWIGLAFYDARFKQISQSR